MLKINNYILVDIGLNLLGRKIKKGISSITGSSITLTNNETKEIIKWIKSLEKKRILLKSFLKKITGQKGFFNFLKSLVTAGLPLIKIVFIPLAKSVLIPFELSAEMLETDGSIQKKLIARVVLCVQQRL